MAVTSSVVVSKAVQAAMSRLAPLRMAGSWDNVGLLIESPIERKRANQRVLLTIDLTTQVTDEALSSESNIPAIIVSYHTPLFRPISSLTLSNPIQRSLLRLASAGVSVWSPHSALDSVDGGINDWILQAFGGSDDVKLSYFGPREDPIVEGERGGYGGGRLGTLNKPITLKDAVAKVKAHFNLKQVEVAYATGSKGLDAEISSVAVCAGSGGSVIMGKPADVYLTGEMSHHEVLEAVATGHHVILCGHTNTERGYLPTLAKDLRAELQKSAELGDVQIDISSADAHPLHFV